MAESSDALFDRWRRDLDAWQIPEEILQAAGRSPWALPRSVFANRARAGLSAPYGVSYDRAREAMQKNGVVLDVGSGAGAASLPLVAAGGLAVGVDADQGMLDDMLALGHSAGRRVEVVNGRWPDIEAAAPSADVVVCHHVLYNVRDLEPFVTALTRHARRRVVVELTSRHPMSSLNPLWQRLHNLKRPDRPTALDAVEAIRALGLDADCEAWARPASVEFDTYAEMLDVTARRLCLPPERLSELDDVLRDLGVNPSAPVIGPESRELVTIWWPGVG